MKKFSPEKIQLVRELHAPARRNFPRRRVDVRGVDDLWQMDLAVMLQYAKVNKNYKYILVVIDACSKFAMVEAVKTKSAADVTKAFETILNRVKRQPTSLQADKGREFYNKGFIELIKRRGINFYSTFSSLKASMAERMIRSLKERLYRIFSLRGSYKWIDVLPSVIDDYNNAKHRTIGMKPIEVWRKSPKQREIISKLLSTVYARERISKKPKFDVGDYVRVSKNKTVFHKSYTGNWTTEIFRIVRVQNTNPVTYLLEDTNGTRIAGGFYEPELSHVKDPNVYLVEKILKRKGDKILVKWLGLSDEQNSWIHEKNVL